MADQELRTELEAHIGDKRSLATTNAGLLTLSLPPEGVVGRFRKRFAPLILERLCQALDDAVARTHPQAIVCPLRFAASHASREIDLWRARARDLLDTLPADHGLADELPQLVD
jgi:hypothetical protein